MNIAMMLKKLQIKEKWLTSRIVDEPFIHECHALLDESDAEHIRTKFYAQFFKDRESSKMDDSDIDVYFELVELEQEASIKSWAIGFMVECGLLTVPQLIQLRHVKALEGKHHIFLEREIIQKCSDYFDSHELNIILKQELEKGNKVLEVSSWPPKCKRLVILEKRFATSYMSSNLEYREIDDVHYWFSEYSTRDGLECLASK